jgi:hypothetical protein
MRSSKNLARKALAKLLDTLKPQKSHRYSTLPSRSEDPSISDLFPPTFCVFSVKDGMFEFAPEQCRLIPL